MPEPDKIQIPNTTGETQSTIMGDVIYFVTIEYDQLYENPTEDCAGMGKMHSLNRHHCNFNEACPQLLKDNPDSVALSYFERGQSMWFIEGRSTPPGVEFQWDGVKFAGVWEPNEFVCDAADTLNLVKGTPDRLAWMQDQAASTCEVYTQWCNGEVYSYDVSRYALRKSEDGDTFDAKDDYRFDEDQLDESSCGYYGYEAVEAAVKEVLKYALEQQTVDTEKEHETCQTQTTKQ